MYLYQVNLFLWLCWGVTSAIIYCSIKLPVPRYLVIRQEQLWLDQHYYTIDSRSRVGMGFCWLCLSENNHRRYLLVFCDMLDKTSYRRLCFSLLHA
ncbi:protein YgfX [Celerinatantimonas sp. MCCC 1A17872]|uniref:protein YgfX n=1 Tax=Celerinatantimonas sp. MCCC 1A17872 TaxID=3177514 RepID=UPI0038BE7D65